MLQQMDKWMQHTGTGPSGWAPVYSQYNTSLLPSLRASCTQRGGPTPFAAVPATMPHVTCWLCQFPHDWPRAYSLPSCQFYLTYLCTRNKSDIYFTHKSVCSHFCKIFLVKTVQLLSPAYNIMLNVWTWSWAKMENGFVTQKQKTPRAQEMQDNRYVYAWQSCL